MSEHQGWVKGEDSYRGTVVEGESARVFIQWKGTDACFDFDCGCGYDGHFDGHFAYEVRCKRCGAVYEMPSLLYPRRIAPGEHSNPVVPDRSGEMPERSDEDD